MKKYRWDKKYLYWGVTAFSVIVASIAFFWVLQRWQGLVDTTKLILGILTPFVWGVIIAYLLSPLTRTLESKAFTPLAGRIFKEKAGKEKSVRSLARSLSIAVSLLALLILIVSLLWLVLPQLYYSVESIVVNIQDFVPKGIAWIEDTLKNYPDIEDFVVSLIGNISDALTNWIKNSVMPQMSNAIAIVSNGLWSVVMTIADIFLGVIISCYITYNKERFGAHIKKILYSTFTKKWVSRILNGVKQVDEAFTGFISGKILDSLIIGLICYVGCGIMRMPYAVLVSVLIGLTNIIPFFGPFIGGVPATMIIFMVSPFKGLIFGIFVILLQQFDGNILGPKILGSSTGLNGFWVMFSILLGGGLFGVMGMICGVPVFSVIYAAIKHIVNSRLEARGLPTSTVDYINLDHIDDQSNEPIKKSPVGVTEDKEQSSESDEQ